MSSEIEAVVDSQQTQTNYKRFTVNSTSPLKNK
jgi:hypothetical protein